MYRGFKVSKVFVSTGLIIGRAELNFKEKFVNPYNLIIEDTN